MWGFNSIKEMAVRGLDMLSPTDAVKLELADQYTIASWFQPALDALIKRVAPLTEEEKDVIGWRLASRIGRAHETRYRRYIEHIEKNLRFFLE